VRERRRARASPPRVDVSRARHLGAPIRARTAAADSVCPIFMCRTRAGVVFAYSSDLKRMW